MYMGAALVDYGPQLTPIYQTYLQRNPNPSEISSWNADIANGVATLASIAQTLLAEVVKGLADEYVRRLGRPATTAELNAWGNQIASGQITFDGAITAIDNLPEAQKYLLSLQLPGQINALYHQYLGRDATATEVQYWTTTIVSGAGTLGNLSAALQQLAQQNAASAQATQAAQVQQPIAAQVAVTPAQLVASQPLPVQQAQAPVANSPDALTTTAVPFNADTGAPAPSAGPASEQSNSQPTPPASSGISPWLIGGAAVLALLVLRR